MAFDDMFWRNNVVGVYLVQVSLLLIGQQDLVLSISAFDSHWLEDCANFTPKPEENNQDNANHSYCSSIQAASQSTFIDTQLYSTCD